MVGINDSWCLYNTAISMLNDGKSKDEIKKYIQEEYIKGLLPYYENVYKKAQENGIKMIACSVLPIEIALIKDFDYRNYYVQELNNKLKELAKKYDADYVDYYGNTVKPFSEDIYKYTLDGCHPIFEGYKIMSNTLKPYLDKYLKK